LGFGPRFSLNEQLFNSV